MSERVTCIIPRSEEISHLLSFRQSTCCPVGEVGNPSGPTSRKTLTRICDGRTSELKVAVNRPEVRETRGNGTEAGSVARCRLHFPSFHHSYCAIATPTSPTTTFGGEGGGDWSACRG